MSSLAELLHATPYISYTYAYPHKTAYRPFPEPLRLDALWEQEDRRSLFLYMHVPFCEMRCGFCNTLSRHRGCSGMRRKEAFLCAFPMPT